MAKQTEGSHREKPRSPQFISQLAVSGYKSIGPEQSIEVRPLTLLAGPNSSGKSSIMQPLLLLKQTLEAPYDPGPLLLRGPNVKFTSIDQMLFRPTKNESAACISVKINTNGNARVEFQFKRPEGQRNLRLSVVYINNRGKKVKLSEELSQAELWEILDKTDPVSKSFVERHAQFQGTVTRDRCFFEVSFSAKDVEDGIGTSTLKFDSSYVFSPLIQDVIHLPGLRGNPERAYPITSVGYSFPGTFENYVASIIAQWASTSQEKLHLLSEDLNSLGLAWKVAALAVDDTQVELKVGRMPKPIRGGAHDLVNITDVGFGVSQTLPVVVALLVAKPGQLVYIEQPEIHLHPRAQVAMARLLVNAANRGVRVVSETHSSLLLLGVQALVAEGVLTHDKVKLHWFQRNLINGATEIRQADLDEAGRFGDWPEDFAQVALETEHRYLNAAEERLAKE